MIDVASVLSSLYGRFVVKRYVAAFYVYTKVIRYGRYTSPECYRVSKNDIDASNPKVFGSRSSNS